MAIVVEYFEVFHDDDGWGGRREAPSVAARFTTLSAAKEYANSKGRYYRAAESRKIMTVYDTVEELSEASKAQARESALAKLTPEERAALGV